MFFLFISLAYADYQTGNLLNITFSNWSQVNWSVGTTTYTSAEIDFINESFHTAFNYAFIDTGDDGKAPSDVYNQVSLTGGSYSYNLSNASTGNASLGFIKANQIQITKTIFGASANLRCDYIWTSDGSDTSANTGVCIDTGGTCAGNTFGRITSAGGGTTNYSVLDAGWKDTGYPHPQEAFTLPFRVTLDGGSQNWYTNRSKIYRSTSVASARYINFLAGNNGLVSNDYFDDIRCTNYTIINTSANTYRSTKWIFSTAFNQSNATINMNDSNGVEVWASNNNGTNWINITSGKSKNFTISSQDLTIIVNSTDTYTQEVWDVGVLVGNDTSAPQIAPDTTKPRINTTNNNTAPKIHEFINISANVTDETGLSFCQFIENMTLANGKNTINNISVSGTDTKCSRIYNITLSKNNVINFTVIINDTSNNLNFTSTILTVADTLGFIRIGINNTSPKINQVINLTGNITEPDGSIANSYISYNISGNPQLNTTFTAINASQAITINLSVNNVVNFTVFYNDTFGLVTQNSSVITIADTLGVIKIGINNTLPKVNEVINVSCNATDPDNNFDFGIESFNVSGYNPALNYSTKLTSVINANFSNSTSINLTRGGVINFTCMYNDTFNTFVRNTTSIEVNNTVPTISLQNPQASNVLIYIPAHFNLTIFDADSDSMTITWYINGTKNQTTLSNTTFNASNSVYNVTGAVSDGFNSSLNFTPVVFEIAVESPSGVAATTGGGGGASGVTLQTKCNAYIFAYQTCYYLDISGKTCLQGCPDGSKCVNLQCINSESQIVETVSQQEALELTWYERTANWFKSLFNTEAPLDIIPIQATVQTVKDAVSTASNEKVNQVANKVSNAINNNATMALIIVGSIALLVAVLTFGWQIVFLNPYSWLIIASSLLLGYTIIYYGVFV